MSTEDLREKCLKAELGGIAFVVLSTEYDVAYEKIKIAMDSYFEARSMELLSFQAKHNVECEVTMEGNEVFYYKGELISKEELFKNFL